jgi:hypothetical protein
MKNIISFVVLSALILGPFCVLMTIVAISSYKVKLESAVIYLKQYFSSRPREQFRTISPTNITILILIALTFICVLGFVIILLFWNYLSVLRY